MCRSTQCTSPRAYNTLAKVLLNSYKDMKHSRKQYFVAWDTKTAECHAWLWIQGWSQTWCRVLSTEIDLASSCLAKRSPASSRDGSSGCFNICPTNIKSDFSVYFPLVRILSGQQMRLGPCFSSLHLQLIFTAVSRSIKQNALLLHFITFGHRMSVWAKFAAWRSFRASSMHLIAAWSCASDVILEGIFSGHSCSPKGYRLTVYLVRMYGPPLDRMRCLLAAVALYIFWSSESWLTRCLCFWRSTCLMT